MVTVKEVINSNRQITFINCLLSNRYQLPASYACVYIIRIALLHNFDIQPAF